MIVRAFTKGKHPFARELLGDELLYGQILIVTARKKAR
jgi:hypothetical protein